MTNSSPEGRQEAAVLDAKALNKLQLWFFRDISDEQRLSLFSIFGMPVDEIGEVHGHQRRALKHILRALIPAKPAVTHRHLKSGHLVREIGRGFAQVSAHPIEEMTAVSIYEHDGRLWVRNAVEFDDGRFAALQAPATPDAQTEVEK